MILELADICIQPGKSLEFEQAIEKGVAKIIAQSEGFEGWKVNRSLESPERYVLQIFWATLEDHTEKFRNSSLFEQWRGMVGPYFASPPVVEHFELVSKSAK